MAGLVTVFGGTGFIGSQVVRALARRGWRVRVAARNPGRGYRLRMYGDVGQIEIVQANLRNEASIARALDGADACINLVGLLFEAGAQKFDSAHVEGARKVARLARDAGVTALVQMSAIGADAKSAAAYARTKAAGEAAVREILPQAVIIRPSIVFGPEDGFFNRFAAMAAASPFLPLVGGGSTRFQPAFVGDVAEAIARAVSDPAFAGRTFELGGPAVYTFRELMELVLKVTQRRRILLPIPFGPAGLIGLAGDIQAAMKGALGLIPAPVVTRDQLELLKHDNVVSGGAESFAELGIQPAAVEPILPTYLVRFRAGGQFAQEKPAA